MSELTAVSAEQGQTLRDIVTRVYRIHEHERVMQVVLILAEATERNRASFRKNPHAQLKAGVVVDLLPWAKVQAELEVLQKARMQALAHVMKAPPPFKRPVLAAPVAASTKTPIERDVVKALIAASPLSSAQAQEQLRPVDNWDPMATLPPQALALITLGRAMAEKAPLSALQTLLASKQTVLTQTLGLFLQALAPRAFALQAKLGPTLQALEGAMGSALLDRFRRASADELVRRFVRLQVLVQAVPEQRPPLASQAFGEDPLPPLTEALAVELAPTLTPAVKAATLQLWHATGDNAWQKSLASLPADAPTPLHRFIDAWEADGPFAAWLLKLGANAKPSGAVERLRPHLPTVTEGSAPLAAFAGVFPEFLRRWRAHRVALSPSEQEDQVAEERRLLAGRNFLSFKKDVAAAVEHRLQREAQLSTQTRVLALVVFMAAVGHRLSGLSAEDLVETLERYLSL